MRLQKWLLLAIAFALVLAFAGLSGCPEHQYEKGSVFDAAMKTLDQEGPVKDDLIARGLYTYPDDETGEPGRIDVGGIKKLVDAGVYEIDEEGYLVFGPSYTPPPE
jgi:hypothetical protein